MKCLQAAAAQDGLITRKQARKLLSERQLQWRLQTKAWVTVLPKVYRIEGAPPGWRQNLRALSLWAKTNFALSHRTAARLHGLDHFEEAKELELIVVKHRETDFATVHRVKALTKAEKTDTDDGFTVTSMARTIIDLASLKSVDTKTLKASVNQALRQKKVTLDQVDVVLARVKGLRGCPRIRTLVHELRGGDGVLESELEEIVDDVIEMAGLPKPEKQHVVKVRGRVRRIDFLYRAQRVIIEAEGYAWHSDVISFEKDRQRRNSLTAAGYVVLQWTWAALQDRPEQLVDELVKLLASR
ncbi:MAG TPA: DUF559 domain-containing protein [Archangium sp.]